MSSLSFAAAHVKETQHLANHITSEVQTPTAQTTLPDCFTDHHAPPSVVSLFAEWTRAADKTDNGVTVINRQRQRYSTATVDRAAKWLKAHHLLFLVERGGGRGNGNRYFVRWSFIHETLSARQNAVNHPEHAKTLSSDTFARVEAFKLLEEKHYKRSFDTSKTFHNVSPVENSKREAFTAANKQQRRLRNEKGIRWAMARLREVTADEDALEAASWNIRRLLASGSVFVGPELAEFVKWLAWDLEGIETAWPVERRDKFSFVGINAWSLSMRTYSDRSDAARNKQEYQERQREREEAKYDPLLAEFSCKAYSIKATPPARRDPIPTPNAIRREVTTQPGKSGYERIHEERATVADDLSQMLQEEGAVHISDLIRREVATAGAVVNSGKRERRQSGEAYQRAGNHHSGSKRATPKQAHKRGEHPVNVCEMMSGYLGKLRGGGNEMERNDKGNEAR
jgi:hypothetical protein